MVIAAVEVAGAHSEPGWLPVKVTVAVPAAISVALGV
jgi:hypothetical protein